MRRLLTTRLFWLLPVFFWAGLVALSFSWNVAQIRSLAEAQARTDARHVAALIAASNRWLSQHGGVYAIEPPAAGLPAARMAQGASSSARTVRHDPVSVLREISGRLSAGSDIQVQFKSLRPLGSDNQAIGWEIGALHSLASGAAEYVTFDHRQGQGQLRLMTPLRAEADCLACHAQAGAAPGDLLGGIAVQYDVAQSHAAVHAREREMALIHLSLWLMLSSITLAALSIIRRQFLQLRTAKAQQTQLVAKRTAELLEATRGWRASDSYLRMLLNASGEGIIGIDTAYRCTFCNPMAARLLGHPDMATLIGQDMAETLAPQRDLDGRPDSRIDLLSGGDGLPFHEEAAWFRDQAGNQMAVEFRAHPLLIEGKPQGAVITFSDITARHDTQQRIWHQANYDALTGLPNRELMHDRLDSALARAHRDHGELAILFIDLDRFKEANDRLGHAAGDHILKEAGRRMTACLREVDTIARLGGDEFLAILPGVGDREAAERVADKIIASLSLPYPIDQDIAEISASIGIAFYPADAATKDKLLSVADHAMYRAKDAGRGTWRVFHNGPSTTFGDKIPE